MPHGSMAGHDLEKLQRDLLMKLHRGGEALEAAWAKYREHACRYTYDDLMRFVPEAERHAWHKRPSTPPRAPTYIPSELYLAVKEPEHLGDLVRRTTDEALEQVSHYVAEPAAEHLEKLHPDLAARVWRTQGMCIVNAKLSRHYDAALRHFERAMSCFEEAGLIDEWEKTETRVRAEHHRKTGFMPGFEDLLAGSGPSDQPSFLERAKARSGKRPEAEAR